MARYRFLSLSALIGSALSFAATGCGGEIESGDYLLLRVAFADMQSSATCYEDDEVPKNIKNDSTSLRTGATLVLFRGPDETYFLDAGKDVMEGTLEDDTFTFKGKSVDVEYINGTPAVVINDTDRDGIADYEDPSVDADSDQLDDRFDDSDVDTDNDGLDDRNSEDEEVDINSDGIDDRMTELTAAIDGDKLTQTTSETVSFTIDGNDVTGTTKVTVKVACSGVTCPKELQNCTQSGSFVGTLVEEAAVEHQL